jgi:predicted acylesterase/phospholipase RssA
MAMMYDDMKYVPAMVLNYRTTPDVLIWSAVLASSAFPNIIAPVELLSKDIHGTIHPYHIKGKKWSDGTIKMDIPIKVHFFFLTIL